jgi:hypothetical protein
LTFRMEKFAVEYAEKKRKQKESGNRRRNKIWHRTNQKSDI